MIPNVCIKNPRQTSGILYMIAVKHIVYKRCWLISHSGWFSDSRAERIRKHGIYRTLARCMFVNIQEANIVVPQQISICLCFNPGQTL